MKETAIRTFAELHRLIESYGARTVICRGVKSVKLPLTPKIARMVAIQVNPIHKGTNKDKICEIIP